MEVRKIDADEHEVIEEYLSLDESLLYSLIPPYTGERVLYTLPGQIEAGKKKFLELIPQLQQKLCVDWELCKKIDDPVLNDQISLVVAIGDVICALVGVIPPNLIATLIIKMGVRAFCSCSRSV